MQAAFVRSPLCRLWRGTWAWEAWDTPMDGCHSTCGNPQFQMPRHTAMPPQRVTVKEWPIASHGLWVMTPPGSWHRVPVGCHVNVYHALVGYVACTASTIQASFPPPYTGPLGLGPWVWWGRFGLTAENHSRAKAAHQHDVLVNTKEPFLPILMPGQLITNEAHIISWSETLDDSMCLWVE